jgi:hypothetical protein
LLLPGAGLFRQLSGIVPKASDAANSVEGAVPEQKSLMVTPQRALSAAESLHADTPEKRDVY